MRTTRKNTGSRRQRLFTQGRFLAVAGIFTVLCQAVPLELEGQGTASLTRLASDDPPTFSRDIAPILQASCQECHQPNGIGPMSLLTYDQVRLYAPLIKERVENRMMPPWHLDKSVGIQDYENDNSLSDRQIETITRWVDAGAPEGDPADLPPPLKFAPATGWELAEELGPPDLVFRSKPYTVTADGQDQWWDPRVEFEGLSEERYLRAAEFKPSYPLGFKVVHHAHVYYRQGERDFNLEIIGMGVGKRWDVLPEGVGKRLPAGPAQISFGLHYFPAGEEVPDDVVETGVWLYPEGYVPELESSGELRFLIDGTSDTGPRARDLIVPPHGYLTLEKAYVLDSPALIESFRPHMHMRGTSMTMEALYPDGRREVLSSVDQYNHWWQISYVYETDAQPLLPKGTVLIFHSQYDNTENNPINPDPDQWVVFGARGADEMSHAWVGVTYLEEEEYERRLDERERPRAP
jgi:hypothetical protein